MGTYDALAGPTDFRPTCPESIFRPAGATKPTDTLAGPGGGGSTGLISGTSLQDLNTSNAYNAYGEPAEESADLPGGGEFTLVYQRDAAGRITGRTETTPSGQTTWTYEYDDRGRLQAAYKDNQPYATYAYDANGNRTTQTAGGDQTTATFDNRDRMRAQGDYEFSYNKNGEMTARENTATNQTATFSYDTFGNLTGAATEDGDQITYKLDSDANRATREVNGQLQSRYIYARGIQGPIAELAGDNTVKARYVYGTRSIVPDYMVKNGNTYRLLTDQLGSVRLVVDASSGDIAQEIEYDPFGVVIRDTNQGFQPFGFAGGLYDSATGLTHFGAREYDARMGRWTAADPISFAGGDSNLYGYVVADPVNLIDPSGLYGVADAWYDMHHPGQTWNAISHALGETAWTIADAASFWNSDCSCRGSSAMDNFIKTNSSAPGLVAPSGSAGAVTSRLMMLNYIPSPKIWILNSQSVQVFPRVLGQALKGTGLATGAWLAGTAIGSVLRSNYGPCD